MSQTTFDYGYIKWAQFSPDKKHRLALYRAWDVNKPAAMVIGLNPSKADANEDDPTIGFIRRVLNYNGYGRFYMMNLFTMITPHPKKLIHDTSFLETIEWWKKISDRCTVVIFAWGNFKTFGRDKKAIELFPDALCFRILKSGAPRHAMYLPENTQLLKYNSSPLKN